MFQSLKISTFILIAALLSGYAAADPIHDCATLDPDTDHAFATLPAGFTLETFPAEFEMEIQTVTTHEAYTTLERLPTTYKWVEGEIEGAENIPVDVGRFEFIKDIIVIKDATTELITIPSDYSSNEVIKSPIEIFECTHPAQTREISRRVKKTPALSLEKLEPYIIKNGKTRIPVEPTRIFEAVHPAVTEDIEVQKVIKPTSFVLRNDKGEIIATSKSPDAFKSYLNNSEE